jgi:hypothetical protein
MRHTPITRRLARAAIMLAGLSCILPAMIGCAGSAPAPEIASGRLTRPPVHLDSTGREHTVVVSSPTPGYEVTLTRVMKAYHRRDVYITIRRPTPLAAYPQMVVEQRIGTGIPSAEPIQVFARIVPFDAKAKKNIKYRYAADSTQASPP